MRQFHRRRIRQRSRRPPRTGTRQKKDENFHVIIFDMSHQMDFFRELRTPPQNMGQNFESYSMSHTVYESYSMTHTGLGGSE